MFITTAWAELQVERSLDGACECDPDADHSPAHHAAFHAGYLAGIEAALQRLEPGEPDDEWPDDERGWVPPDDYDESVDGIGEAPSGVRTDLCPCGGGDECSCAAGCLGCNCNAPATWTYEPPAVGRYG